MAHVRPVSSEVIASAWLAPGVLPDRLWGEGGVHLSAVAMQSILFMLYSAYALPP